ncbi:MAG TPA: Rieske 2Fe-2S domain-containing protein [Gaiellaceae bacterium]|nr:Rieske 2Fe-2S domain-containing protein [Gaiellaceae bacterium]
MACLLLGLVISWVVAAIGAVLAVVFGLLWARDVTRDVRGEVPEIQPETRTGADAPSEPVLAVPADVPLPAFPRSRFLEASLIGLSAALGGVLTIPILGFMVLPPFTNVDEEEADLGPIENFPEGEYVIASYLANPSQGEVSRRTAFVRYNGAAETGEPSFTILYSRCVHLGCPVQPNGPIDEDARQEINGIELRPVLAQSFGCPCHGGQYDSEGNRQAGPPVRSMDRYTYTIRNGRLILGELYAVGNVSGTGANATISKYPWSVPGTHVDGVSSWLYPIVPGQVTG